ncbi:glycosyltransferase family 4 protein [Enterobacter sp. E76]|nr:glycosyltransferase family 4 protein [Enterobacter sp. E76]
MKIIFGTDAIKYPLTGIGRYAYELAKSLNDSHDISELMFLNGGRITNSLPNIEEKNQTTEMLRNKLKKNYVVSELYRLTSPWLKTLVLRKHPKAIYHGPNFYLPPGINRSVSTFHDLSVFTMPQCHPVERVRFMQKELLLTLKRASVLITDSEFIRTELIDYFNLPAKSVYVAKLACSDEFYPRDEIQLTETLFKYQLKYKHYCLFTGSIEPRKNIESLINAYESLSISIRRNIPLVVCGFKGWNSENIHKKLERGQREGWVRYLGYVPSTELPLLFSGALSFIFPSLYEGFGLPVLEALASGTPVVCSNSSSIPEVGGDAALMCEAMDVDTLTKNINRSIDDKIWRETAIMNGLKQANHFTWQRCAQETIFAYRHVE